MAEVGLEFDDGVKHLDKTIDSYKQDIAQIRGGVASVDMVKDILVESYGEKQPVEHVAVINKASARSLTLKPYDPSLLDEIAQAIKESRSNYEVNVKNNQVYVNLPPLTDETRKEYVKLLKDKTENFRQRLRDVRHKMRDYMDSMKDDIQDDIYYRKMEEIDKVVSQKQDKIDEIYSTKEESILKN